MANANAELDAALKNHDDMAAKAKAVQDANRKAIKEANAKVKAEQDGTLKVEAEAAAKAKTELGAKLDAEAGEVDTDFLFDYEACELEYNLLVAGAEYGGHVSGPAPGAQTHHERDESRGAEGDRVVAVAAAALPRSSAGPSNKASEAEDDVDSDSFALAMVEKYGYTCAFGKPRRSTEARGRPLMEVMGAIIASKGLVRPARRLLAQDTTEPAGPSSSSMR